MNVVLQGTGTFTFSKAAGSLNNLTCASSGKITTVTNIGGGSTGGILGVLTLNGGTLSNQSATDVYHKVVAQTAPVVMNSPTALTGTRRWVMTFTNTSALTLTLPAMNFSETTGILLYKSSGAGTVALTQTGDICWGYSNTALGIGVAAEASLGVFTYNTGNYALSILPSPVNFFMGSPSQTANVVFNFGSSAVSVANFAFYAGYTYQTMNFGTSTWTVTGSWTFSTGTTVTNTSAVITFDGSYTGTVTINSLAKTFPSIVINGVGDNFSLLTNVLTCASLTVTNGIFNQNSLAITVNAGNASFGGSDALTLNTTLTMSNSGSSTQVP
jgi:hypothetical protein